MMYKFCRLYSQVYNSLREQKVSVDTLVTHLLSVGAFDPVHSDSQNQKPALQAVFKQLRAAATIEDVLFIVKDYISFFNYGLIALVVDGLGTDKDRVLLKNYEKELDQYSQRRVYECSQKYGSKSDTDHTELVVKIDSVFEEYTLKELQDFQHRLSGALHVSPLALRLCEVEEGCLLLLFQVPSFVELEIFPLSSEQERALVAEGVVRLTCGGYQFATKVCSYCIVTCHTVPSIELNNQMTVCAAS